MGSETENIFQTFSFSRREDAYVIRLSFGKSNAYFMPKRNVMYERSRFYLRVQLPEEPAENFIHTLHELEEAFPKKNNQIKDRLVIILQNKDLFDRLQLIPDLELEKARQLVKRSMQTKSHMVEIHKKKLDELKP